MKKTGFTLIELLAVIVVLAIIALIATPLILGVIEKARKGASEASALNYIDAVEKYMVLSELDSEKYPVKLMAGETYQVSDVEYKEIGLLDYFIDSVKAEETTIFINDLVDIKGAYPESGIVTIGSNNTVEKAEFDIENYNVLCEEDECKIMGKTTDSVKSVTINNTETSVVLGDTLQLDVTVDPVGSSVTYKSSDESIATVSSTGLVTAVNSGDVVITVISGRKRSQIELTVINPVCIRAKSLHNDGTNDFGSLGTKGELNPGDAYDCDVDGSGTYDSDERFYYVSDYYNTSSKSFESDTAVLLYYTNVSLSPTGSAYIVPNPTSTVVYHASSGNLGPVVAAQYLPGTFDWTNVSLKNTSRDIFEDDGTKLMTYNYSGKAARFITYEEINTVIKAGTAHNSTGQLANNTYLLENTKTYDTSYPYGYWLETSCTSNPVYTTRVDYRFTGVGYGNANDTVFGVRPAIEVPKTNMQI